MRFPVLRTSCLFTALRPRERSLSLRQRSPVASLVLRKSPVLWANICQAADDSEQPQHLSSIAQGSIRSTHPVGDKATHSSRPHDTIVKGVLSVSALSAEMEPDGEPTGVCVEGDFIKEFGLE